MSEFSQTYHLVADDQGAGVDLLREVPVRGFVFPPSNGWVTFVPDEDEYGRLNQDVVGANPSTLLHLVSAEDHGWEFSVFERDQPTCTYRCTWEWDVEVEDSQLNLDVVERLSQEHGEGISMPELNALLHPPNLDALMSDQGNPADRFARSVGLVHFSWISWHYLTVDDAIRSQTPGIYQFG